MDLIEEFIKNIKQSTSYKKQIVHIEELPAHKAIFGELEQPLSEKLQNVLLNRKIKLYSHQAQAINGAIAGKNIVITTPTASGKTLAFNIPVLEALTRDKKATALYIYPTKALTNDQLKVIKELEKDSGLKIDPNIYDGDTPQHQRASIRENSRIILTNPYGLHQYLSWHAKWRTFFQNLKFIIIDEAHIYRGVFGSNVAMVIRRLLRICMFYHANPQIILSSATIANPKEHAKRLTGKDFETISNDGSPKGKKFFVFWNPPLINTKNALRRSTHQETKDLLVLNVLQDLQTICFTTSRQMAELVTRWTKDELLARSKSANVVTAYRAGYLPQERREIESRLKSKSLVGVVSTNALELGVDIGSLDSVIISGYPGTVISTWQQAGRAGRSNLDSLVILVAFQNPLDQYFMKHPTDFFGRSHEQAIIDLHNRYISLGHIMCASSELPINECDKQFFSELFTMSLQALEQEKLVQKTPRGWVYSGTARATEVVSLESISNKTVTVLCNGVILETLTLNKAYEETHEGAVLLHQGETYICESLDLYQLVAKVKQENINYYTEVVKCVNVTISKSYEKIDVDGVAVELGELSITEIYPSYVTKTHDTIIKKTPLDLPPLTFLTVGLWFTLPDSVRENIEDLGLDFAGGLHAIEHAMIALSPIFAMCDRWDVGGLSTSLHPDTQKPSIFIYDGSEGGIGISETLYSKIKLLWEKTLDLIDNCECSEGCPSCIYSPKCGNENEPLDKKAANIILKEMVNLCTKGASKV
ncbi:MAG: DEAD/DEAH box helicase [Nitrososphaerota archaeon]|jgi:DEAD/DEAH box helicase domain-containing protein|nr:DEAD/DEAH box helicase [Nitrososphaerota archaeon]